MDVFLLKRAFATVRVPTTLHFVVDGQEAIDYLQGSGQYSDRSKHPLPGLLLLDLKMPLMDGFDVMAWLRGQPHFNTLPVVVLTSSKLQTDVEKSRELGVYDFRVKPHSFEDLVRVLDDVRKCWLDERYNRFAGKAGAG